MSTISGEDALQALQQTQTAIMMVNPDFEVVFANDATMALLKEHEAAFQTVWPNFKADGIMGTCIDRFHADPSHQRKLLADPKNLPWNTHITVGDLVFRLQVSQRAVDVGAVSGFTLEWKDVTAARQQEKEAYRLSLAIDQAQTPIMMVDRDFLITYANKATMELLKHHEATFAKVWPGFSADAILGTCIDSFHKDPSHQRTLLADPKNLPFRTKITIDDLIFSLQVSGQFDKSGDMIGHTLEWSDITDAEAKAKENIEYKRTSDATSKTFALINFKPDGTIVDANDNFLAAMGYRLEEIEGKNHSMFCTSEYIQSEYHTLWETLRRGEAHTNEVQRVTKDGRRIWLQASYVPISDDSGKVVAVTKFAFDVTANHESRQRFEEAATTLGVSSSELNNQSSSLLKDVASVDETSASAKQALDDANHHLASVTEASKELVVSVSEIASSATNAARVASSAVGVVADVENRVAALTERSVEIGKVVNTIASVAAQTNLLALNATIEAARAGEAGKGFAVVASEVKELAKGTASSTEDITRQVDEIAKAAEAAGLAMKSITDVIEEINGYQAAIASAVEEQSATTKEIGRSMDEVVRRSCAAGSSMQSMREITARAAAAAEEVSKAAGGLADLGATLRKSKGGDQGQRSSAVTMTA